MMACGAPEAIDAGHDAAVDAGLSERACSRRSHCPAGTRCLDEGVSEIAFEGDEDARCRPEDEAIGAGPPRLPLRPGGPPLAARLCLAQGLWPGGGTTARRRELVRGTGAAVMRLDFRWDDIERVPGEIDLSGHDVMVDAAIEDGVEVLGILAYGVPWATEASDDPFYPPDDPADFARYAAAVVAHFEGRVRRWEIWNEQNAGYRFWLPGVHGDAMAYADLLSASAQAMHEACAGCEVIAGGLFFHEQVINGAIEFTRDMLSARPNVFAEVDTFAFHPYPRYPPREPPELDAEGARSFGAMVADLREVLARHGVRDMPFAVTELGWPVHDIVDEDEQARLLSRAMLIGAAVGMDPICWFNVTDGPNHGRSPPEDDFGLYRYGSEDAAQPVSPKPARDAMAWLAQVGETAGFVGALGDAELHDPARGRYALDFGEWRVFFALEPFHATLTPGRAFDHLGRPRMAAADGYAIGPDPIFLLPE